MLILTEGLYKYMSKAAKGNKKEEICGLFGGIAADCRREVKEIYFLGNIYHSPVRFAADVREQLETVGKMRRKGLAPVGFFHSHPEGGGEMSAKDKEFARENDISYAIISFDDNDETHIRSFVKMGDTFAEEEILIERE